MAKLGTFTIHGSSGNPYRLDAFPANTVWTPISAVYIMTHREFTAQGSASHVCLFIGQLANLQELRLPIDQTGDHAVNCICVLEEHSEDRRLEIVTDIASGNSLLFGY